MKSPPDRETDRSRRIEYVSTQLLARAQVLTRLLAKQVDSELSHTEAKVLNTLRADLATTTDEQIEALAAATETLESLIDLLQQPRRSEQTKADLDRSTPVR